MTAIQAPIAPSSHAELGTKGGRLGVWLLTVDGALEFDLFSVSWQSNVFWKVVTYIFCAPECFMFG